MSAQIGQVDFRLRGEEFAKSDNGCYVNYSHPWGAWAARARFVRPGLYPTIGGKMEVKPTDRAGHLQHFTFSNL